MYWKIQNVEMPEKFHGVNLGLVYDFYSLSINFFNTLGEDTDFRVIRFMTDTWFEIKLFAFDSNMSLLVYLVM